MEQKCDLEMIALFRVGIEDHFDFRAELVIFNVIGSILRQRFLTMVITYILLEWRVEETRSIL